MYKSFVFFLLIVAAGAGIWFLRDSQGSATADTSIASRLKVTASNAPDGTVDIEKAPKVEKVERPTVSKTGPYPKVVVGETVFPFGRMEVGQDQHHIFELKNAGDADLVMTAGDTTCKCTTFGFGRDPETAVRKTTLKPGESMSVVIKWKSGEDANRSFRHGGSVYTNDPNTTEIPFAVEGAIEMSYELLPQIWNVGNVFSDGPAKIQCSIASKIHAQFEIESAAGKSGKVKVDWVPMDVGLRAREGYLMGWTFNVEVSPEIPVGLFEDQIEIRIKGRPNPLTARLNARRHGLIRLQPIAGTSYDADKVILQMGSFSPRDGRECRMLLTVDEKDMTEPLQITDKKAEPSFVSAAIEPFGNPTGTVHRYLLKISVPPGRPQSHKTTTNPGFVELTTNHPTGESIKFGLLMYSH